MATPTQIRRRGRWSLILGTVFAAVMFAAVAYADNLKDDAVATGNDVMVSGTPSSVNYWIQSQGGCDVSAGSPQTISINAPTGVTASPASLSFTACNTGNEGNPNNTQSVSFSSTSLGAHEITATSSLNTINTNPATFTLKVNPRAATNLSATANGSDQINLSWGLSADNAQLTKYVITHSVGGTVEVSPPASGPGTYNHAGLTPETEYCYTIKARYTASAVNYDSASFPASGTICATTDAETPADTTAPAITPTVVGTLGNNGWYTSDVDVSWSVVDNESAISSSSGCDSTTISADTTSTTLTCSATSAGGTASSSVTIQRDATPPVAVCPSPEPVYGGASLPQTLSATVTDATPGSGVKAGSGTAQASDQDGGSVSVTGEDNAGNATPATCSYHVVRGGFLAPIDNPPVLNVAKWGRVVPVKFNLIYDGVAVSNPTANVTISVVKLNSCDISAGTDAIELYEAAGSANSGPAFRYTAPHWTYNLDTSGYAINACYRVTVVHLEAAAGAYLLKVTK